MIAVELENGRKTFEVTLRLALTSASMVVTGDSLESVRQRLRRSGFEVVSITEVHYE